MRLRAAPLVVVAVLLVASAAWAQFRRGGNASINAHMAQPDSFDGRFHYCRAMYRSNMGGEGGNWLTDYPLADIDLSIRLAELTKTPVGFADSGQPQHLIVRLTDEALFQCPFIMMQEVGRLFLNDEDAAQLRTYLLKGGFLWVDDFWGSYSWSVWERQIQKALLQVSSRSSICRRTTRFFTRCSTCKGCRRFPASTSGTAAEAARRSGAPTAFSPTRVRLPIATAV